MTSYAAVQLQFYRHFWVMTDHRLYDSMSYCLKKKQVSSWDIYRNMQNNGCWLGQRWLGRKGGQVLQIVLTLFHTAAKKKMGKHEIKSTAHEIMEEAFQLHEKLICSILAQEAIRLWGVSLYHKGLKGGLSLEITLETSNSRNLHCPLSGQGCGSQTVSQAFSRNHIKIYHNIFYFPPSTLTPVAQ